MDTKDPMCDPEEWREALRFSSVCRQRERGLSPCLAGEPWGLSQYLSLIGNCVLTNYLRPKITFCKRIQ